MDLPKEGFKYLWRLGGVTVQHNIFQMKRTWCCSCLLVFNNFDIDVKLCSTIFGEGHKKPMACLKISLEPPINDYICG